MMVLHHEAEHLARHDPQWSALQRLVGALLWFNPFVHAISRRLRLAAELASDAAAVGADPRARRPYAQAYLETLRITAMRTHSEAGFAPVVAFSAQDKGSHAMRINHVVNGDQRSPRHPRLAAVLGGLALASGLGLSVVQAASALPDAGPVSFMGPIIDGRISSHFGTRRPELSKHAHNGIDLAAARGTAVHAPAAGVVSVATSHYEPVPGYGSVIVVEHGDGWQSLYAHLDSIDVRVGESVSSGQMIGRVGTTGLATGPHVHVEVLRDGERIDPASVIAEPVGAK
jgi:murein DD-endopeptidase MepM/ murein hydrolase activator NlpD